MYVRPNCPTPSRRVAADRSRSASPAESRGGGRRAAPHRRRQGRGGSGHAPVRGRRNRHGRLPDRAADGQRLARHAGRSRPLGAPRRPGPEGQPLLRSQLRRPPQRRAGVRLRRPPPDRRRAGADVRLRHAQLHDRPLPGRVPVRCRAVPRLGHRLEGSARRAQGRLRRARRALSAHDGRPVNDRFEPAATLRQ